MKTLSYFFALIFLIQTSASASAPVKLLTPEVYHAVVEHYNSLSQEDRVKLIKVEIERFRSSDPEFLEKNSSQLEDLKWPDLQYKDGKFSFKAEGKSVSFELLEGQKLRIKGKVIEYKPGKMATTLTEIEKALTSGTFSLMTFLIPEAQANPVILIALLAVVVWLVLLHPAINWISASLLRIKCFEIRNQLGETSSLSAAEATEMKSKVGRILSETERNLAQTNCRINQGMCDDLNKARTCYRQVQSELNETYGPHVNESSRGFLKDFMSPRTSPIPPTGGRRN